MNCRTCKPSTNCGHERPNLVAAWLHRSRWRLSLIVAMGVCLAKLGRRAFGDKFESHPYQRLAMDLSRPSLASCKVCPSVAPPCHDAAPSLTLGRRPIRTWRRPYLAYAGQHGPRPFRGARSHSAGIVVPCISERSWRAVRRPHSPSEPSAGGDSGARLSWGTGRRPPMLSSFIKLLGHTTYLTQPAGSTLLPPISSPASNNRVPVVLSYAWTRQLDG